MKIDVVEVPALVTVRLIPENKSDEKMVTHLDTILRGANVLHTTPILEGKKSISLFFQYAKTDQKKKAKSPDSPKAGGAKRD